MIVSTLIIAKGLGVSRLLSVDLQRTAAMVEPQMQAAKERDRLKLAETAANACGQILDFRTACLRIYASVPAMIAGRQGKMTSIIHIDACANQLPGRLASKAMPTVEYWLNIARGQADDKGRACKLSKSFCRVSTTPTTAYGPLISPYRDNDYCTFSVPTLMRMFPPSSASAT